MEEYILDAILAHVRILVLSYNMTLEHATAFSTAQYNLIAKGVRDVQLHDSSIVLLSKLGYDYRGRTISF